MPGPESATETTPRLASVVPVATYRVQLGPDLSFDDAAAAVPYLAALGISHLYLSPIFQALPGSTHGYDVVDPERLSDDLGGAAAYRRLVSTLRSHGMGQVVDVVPNHMAAVADNAWWWDVLENGPASVEADTFDIDWDAADARDRPGRDSALSRRSHTILAPVLGDHYGRVIDHGELRVVRDGGRFELRYHEHRFPIAPRSVDGVLAGAAQRVGPGWRSERLGFFADAFGALPGSWRTERAAVHRRHRDKEVLAELLGDALDRDQPMAAAVDEQLAELNRDPAAMDTLADRQNYRLAHWRSGAYELDYRRFFDITTLVGLRMDRRELFERTHAKLFALVEEGCIDGLRIDHPDGLRDPARYLRWLAERLPHTWIVVEKILAFGEDLAPWPVSGTTGYEFAALLGGVMLDPRGEAPLSELYRSLHDGRVGTEDRGGGDEGAAGVAAWPAVASEAKRDVLRRLLPADLSRLTALFLQVCDLERAWRDYPAEVLRAALEDALVSVPRYRTYRSPDEALSEADQETIAATMAAAAAQRPGDPAAVELFGFLGEILLGRRGGALGEELTARFQQLTAPIMAKGIEDTAGYRYLRLGPCSEVGCDPGRFAADVADFHRHNEQVARRWPTTMTTTSTHDTKRSEDVRARLSVLSEQAEHWAATVHRWRARSVPYRSAAVDGWAEHVIYESMVGAWPLPSARAEAVVLKALREAKRRTSWLDPDADYERDVLAFLHGCYDDAMFLDELQAFVSPLVVPGRMVGLSLVLAKYASPGVPDLYQGTERWDNSLVDPDNRRAVDFAVLAQRLEQLHARRRRGAPVPDEVLDLSDDDGLAKLHTITTALRVRREHPDTFGPAGGYRPCAAGGRAASHVVAWQRGTDVIAVIGRLRWALDGPEGTGWADTALAVPAGRWHHELTGQTLEGPSLALSELFHRFPVALLTRVG